MLQANELTYRHKTHTLLQDVDVALHPGELLVIAGPNGAGKSTLLSLLAHESGKHSEAIVFKQKAFKNWDGQELPRHKAKFSQSHNSDIPLKVRDIVLMGRYPYFNTNPSEADEDAVLKAIEETDVQALKERDYNSLSGGEKQRVHLARVLAQLDNDVQNRLLFLDEPLNNLDVLHQHRILHRVKDFTEKGNAAVMVLHDLNLAACFADRVMLLQQGKVVAHDAPAKIFTREIISRVYNFPCTICTNPLNNNPLIIFGT